MNRLLSLLDEPPLDVVVAAIIAGATFLFVGVSLAVNTWHRDPPKHWLDEMPTEPPRIRRLRIVDRSRRRW